MCCVLMKNDKKLYVAADSLFNLPYVDVKTEEAIRLVIGEESGIEEIETYSRGKQEENASDSTETLTTIIQQSPFTHYFKNALKEDELNCQSQDGEEENIYLSPASFKIITSAIHLLPLWTSVMSSVEETVEEEI